MLEWRHLIAQNAILFSLHECIYSVNFVGKGFFIMTILVYIVGHCSKIMSIETDSFFIILNLDKNKEQQPI